MTDLPMIVASSTITSPRPSASAASPSRFASEEVAAPDPNTFQDAMALAQASKPEAAAPASTDSATLASSDGNDETSDAASAQAVDALAVAPGVAMLLSPAPAPRLSAQSPYEVAFSTAASANQGQVVEAKPGIVATPLNLEDSGTLAWQPGMDSLSEAGTSDATLGQGPLRPALAPMPQTNASILPTQTQTTTIAARVGEHSWGQGLGDRLVWMASQKQQVAELRLNPADLGPLKITITIDQNQASAQFISAHASVRDAIESAMPRLREMLADNGITLGHTSVGAETFREQTPQQSAARPGLELPPPPAMSHVMAGQRLLQQARGLVDTFA